MRSFIAPFTILSLLACCFAVVVSCSEKSDEVQVPIQETEPLRKLDLTPAAPPTVVRAGQAENRILAETIGLDAQLRLETVECCGGFDAPTNNSTFALYDFLSPRYGGLPGTGNTVLSGWFQIGAGCDTSQCEESLAPIDQLSRGDRLKISWEGHEHEYSVVSICVGAVSSIWGRIAMRTSRETVTMVGYSVGETHQLIIRAEKLANSISDSCPVGATPYLGGPLTASFTDRTDCAQVSGTAYRSSDEREWFDDNCAHVTSENSTIAPLVVEDCPPPPAELSEIDRSLSGRSEDFLVKIIGSVIILFDPDTTFEERSFVEEGIRIAEDRSKSWFGQGVQQLTCFYISALQATGDHVGYANNHSVVILRDSQPAEQRIALTIHEYIHILQSEWRQIGWGQAPRWLVEGSAEYLSYIAMVEAGHMSYDHMLAIHGLPYPTLSQSLGLEELAYDEFWLTQCSGGLCYNLSMAAVESLVQNAGFMALVDYFQRVAVAGDLDSLFSETFGVSLEEFYNSW